MPSNEEGTTLTRMIGGPVFGTDGIVYGMDVGLWTRKCEVPDKEPIILYSGTIITVEELNDALEHIK